MRQLTPHGLIGRYAFFINNELHRKIVKINLLNTILTNLKLDIKRYDRTKIHTNIIILFISLFLFIKNQLLKNIIPLRL